MAEFHNHQNSVNPNIQFIKEVEEESRLSGLHNQQGVRRDTSVFIRNWNIAQKQTDLDCHSHHPVQHKRSVVDAFRYRAGQIPSTATKRSREESTLCGWSKLVNRTATPLATFLTTATLPSWFGSDLAVISCQRHLWENLTNVTPQQCRFPLNVLRARFPRPKDPTLQPRGVVYKIGCLDGDFCYYGQTNWTLATQDKKGGSRDLVVIFFVRGISDKSHECYAAKTLLK